VGDFLCDTEVGYLERHYIININCAHNSRGRERVKQRSSKNEQVKRIWMSEDEDGNTADWIERTE